MTSASELFFNRRSRIGRSSHDLGLDCLPSDRNFYPSVRRNGLFSGAGGNSRQELDGCDPSRRHPQARSGHFRGSHQERAGFRAKESTSHYGSSYNSRVDTENLISTSRPTVTANGRLPGSVLLARARLSERLRGLPLPGTGPQGRVTRETNSSESWPGPDPTPVDAREWVTANFARTSLQFPDFDSQAAWLQSLREKSKKPGGLTQEALDCLPLEPFTCEAADCSICLESFVVGDQIVRLPCEHRFHSACLLPWVRICGDCPYCRRVITVKKRTAKKLQL